MNYLRQFHVKQTPVVVLLWFASQLRIISSTPPPGFVKKPDTDLHPPKYEFGYEVRDGGGGRQGHLEARDGVYALGKYYVRLPNGSDQKVNYFADDWGYHPLVEYNSASPSSSSSAQFAMGEKAVAALVKTLSEAKPTDVTNILQQLSHREHASTSLSSSGVTEKYSNTATSPSASNSVTSDVLESELLTNSQVPAASPSYTEQRTHIVTVTAETPTTLLNSHSVSAPSVTEHEQIQTVNYQANTETRLTSPLYNLVSDIYKNTPQENYLNFESKRYNYVSPQRVTSNYVDETQKGTTEQVVTIGGKFRYNTESRKTSGSNSYDTVGNGQKELVQVTSYLADNEAAVDVSSNGEIKNLPGVTGSDSGGATTISAFLIAEDDRKVEYNEVERENQGSIALSTTVSPNHLQKETFGPIIVPNNPTHTQGAYYTGKFSSTTEPLMYHDSEQINNLQTYSQYNDSRTEENDGRVSINLQSSSGLYRHNISPTPAPTPEPVLVTPREDASQLTSSDQILAPIQAAVSLSASTSRLELDNENKSYENDKTSDSMEPVVEKQMLEEQSVYKTTIDVQKSIPFEIAENNYEERDSSNDEIEINQSTSPPPYQQGTYLPIHESINNEFSKIDEEQTLTTKKNQFLQQVLMAYQKMSNNYANEGNHLSGVQGIQVYPTHVSPAVPNNLYYIYLQRFNPASDRYGVQPQRPVYYQLPYQTTLQTQGSTVIPNGYTFSNNLPSVSTFNLPKTKFIPGRGLNVKYSTHLNDANYEKKYYSSHSDKAADNTQSTSLNLENSDSDKTKLSEQPTYNFPIVKEEIKPDPSIISGNRVANHPNSQASEVQSILNGQNGVPYFNNPFNTIFANNLNKLSSSAYQKYLESTAATIGKVQGRENINGFNSKNSGLAIQLQNQENPPPFSGLEHSVFPYQVRKYGEENNVGTNANLEQYGAYTLPNIPLLNPTVVPQVPLKLQPIPITKMLPISAYPTPFPATQGQLPQQISQPVVLAYQQPANIPNGQYLTYPQVENLPQKQFQPIYVYEKNENSDLQRKTIDNNGNQPPFRPSQKLYHSVYPPETYYVTEYLKTNSRTRGNGKKLCIEYGGFKPPLIPSIQIDDKFEHKLEKKSDKTNQN